jgi:2-polyprenyl-3-methyl-5-hydroxy-6-metoxy-1,4-benzoquinol methylase
MKKHSMLTQEEMTRLQAEGHDLIDTAGFRSAEEYVIHLIHTAAYAHAARLVEGKTVLDLGCNTGYGTELLSRSAGRVDGVDVSESAIAAARSTYRASGIEFQVIDGKSLPFDSGVFDVIVSFQVIEHIVNYANFIGEIRRVLAPGGVVVFTTPNALIRLDPGMKPWNEFHVREFSHSELRSLLGEHFQCMSILGLFANEPLYSIEVNRLTRGREKARVASAGGLSVMTVRQGAKRILPRGVLRVARAVRNLVTPGSDARTADLMEKHGVESLFYQEDNLESALDLMAVCSDDQQALEDSRRKMVKRMT